jgi:DHA1 family tetracycline resistance protein-like MFS transporter
MTDPSAAPSEPATAAEPAPAPRSAMFIAFLVVFIDLLGFGIVLPLLPRYAKEYLAPVDVPEWFGGFLIGALYSSFSLMQFLVAPIWGRISDRIGRRPVLLIGLAGSVVFYALFGLASEIAPDRYPWLALGLLFLSRLGAGVAGATISTAAAVIADCTTKANRARGMALIGLAFGIGFTFGPLIAFAAVTWFPQERGAPGYAAAGMSFIALLLGMRLLVETRRPHAEERRRSLFDVQGLYRTLYTPTVGLLVLSFFLATFGFASFEATLALLTAEAFHYSNEDNFLIFAYIGGVLALTQGFVYRPLAKKLDEVTLMRIGIVAMFLGLASLAAITAFAPAVHSGTGITTGGLALATLPSPSGWLLVWFLSTLAIAVMGFAFLNPSINALISKRSDPNQQGEVLGVNQKFSALARIVGPVVGLWLFSIDNRHVLPYVLASGLLGIVLVLLPRIQRG